MIPLPPEETGNEDSESAYGADELDGIMSSTNNTTNTTATSVATLSSPWQFDDLQVSCAGCRSEFNSLTLRRHHCRLCGKIYCAGCSNQRALIPPSSIVLVPRGGKKVKPRSAVEDSISYSPDDDPDRMLTYLNQNKELLYGKGLEERFKLAREPLRVCRGCYQQLLPLQDELRNCNSNAMRFNYIDPTDPRRLFNSPLAFTLGHEIRKAAYTLNNLLPLPKRMGAVVMSTSNLDNNFYTTTATDQHSGSLQQCKEACTTVSPNLGNIDGVRIPARLLEQARGMAFLTVVKGGFGLAGAEFGTGLVVARLDAHRWSAPSAIGTAGLSWGALIGAQVSDHVFLLMNDAAVEMLFNDTGSVQLGADVGVALGPLGRALEADLGAAPGSVAPIYTYSLSKGFYAGVSLDGKVIRTRQEVNEKFYGRRVSGQEILQGAVPTPPAAQPLYEALQRCHVYATSDLSSTIGRGDRRRLITPSNPRSPVSPSSGQHNHHDEDIMDEYGELPHGAHMPTSLTSPAMSSAFADHRSLAGMSDITSDAGY